MRSQFDQQLKKLNTAMITMGSLCEDAIDHSMRALMARDKAIAAQVPELAGQIDQLEREIEAQCLKLLLQQQPVARDLRVISAALKMVTDLERVGHQSAEIAEILEVMDLSAAPSLPAIREMANATRKMVTNSISAFVHQDPALAKNVEAYDDVVDDYFVQVRSQLIALLRDPAVDAESTVDLLMITKYFERMGDHAVNIAGWVVYTATGSRESEGI
ncbi:MAG: phosphate signaling complex protein PhoU [Firmicutes bacterium]|nr:phosphate signaling complex protein PhoU [Bacillota bacterium]